MPTYEYHCDACDHNFDEFQTFSEPALKKCPKCGRLKLRRVFGAGAAVLFKGSGFYQTDYRSESYKQAAKADSEKAAPAADKNGAAKEASANGTTAAKGEGRKSSGKTSKSAT